MKAHMKFQRQGDRVDVNIQIQLIPGKSLMEYEEEILGVVNELGRRTTGYCIEYFDTDGSPIMMGETKWTSKGRVHKNYQTPYGEAPIERHVYQSSAGGTTFCPLDEQGRIVNSSTPRFARMCAFKYALLNSSTVAQKDLDQSHGRPVSRCYLRDIAQEVGQIVEAKQSRWKYADPEIGQWVHTVGLGVDGTCMFYCQEGWRVAMVGTLSLYNVLGERLHTIYVGEAPEYGKERFYQRMEEEIVNCRQRYPWARWIGIADGAKDHWPWLEQWTDQQILDYYHAASYLDRAAPAMCSQKAERGAWRDHSAHRLKHKVGGAKRLLREMKTTLIEKNPKGSARQELETTIGYFENNVGRMNYGRHLQQHLPIGSGVTEAACKTLVKQRLCGSGMKWKESGATTVLNLRSLILTEGRWEQFWSKVVQFGF